MAVRPNDLVVGLLALVGFACSHAVNASAALLNPLDAEVVAKAQDFLLQLNIMQMRIHNGNELFLYSVFEAKNASDHLELSVKCTANSSDHKLPSSTYTAHCSLPSEARKCRLGSFTLYNNFTGFEAELSNRRGLAYMGGYSPPYLGVNASIVSSPAVRFAVGYASSIAGPLRLYSVILAMSSAAADTGSAYTELSLLLLRGGGGSDEPEQHNFAIAGEPGSLEISDYYSGPRRQACKPPPISKAKSCILDTKLLDVCDTENQLCLPPASGAGKSGKRCCAHKSIWPWAKHRWQDGTRCCTVFGTPAGTYVGVKTVLGYVINATLVIDSATTLDLSITGAANINCTKQTYSIDDNDVVKLPAADVCIYSALSDNNLGDLAVVYDASDNTITVSVKEANVLPVKVVLEHKA